MSSYKVLKTNNRTSFSEIGQRAVTDLSLERVKVENQASESLEKLRKVAAEKLSYKTAPMVFVEVDMGEVIAIREKCSSRLGFMPFIIRALTSALKESPEIYGNEPLSLSVALGLENEKIASLTQNLDVLSVKELEEKLKELGVRARAGNFSTDLMDQKSFTVLNAGSFGSLFSAPKMDLAQIGILGVHDIVKRSSVVGDEMGSSSMMYLTFSYDYRIIDGKSAAPFLTRIKEKLEDPVWIAEGL